MSRPTLRGWLKAVAADFCQLLNSPSTRKDFSDPTFLMKPILLVYWPRGPASRLFLPKTKKPRHKSASPASDHLVGAGQI